MSATEETLDIIRPGFQGRKVYLRPTTLDDMDTFLRWEEGLGPQRVNQTNFEIRSQATLLEDYRTALTKGETGYLSVIVSKDDQLAGRIRYVNLDSRNKSVELEFLLPPDLKERDVKKNDSMAEGTLLFAAYMFRQYDLNCVHTTIGEFDKTLVRLMEELKFKRDGVLRRRFYYNGEFRDLFIYSLLRYELEP